jgi:hypothetical protein
MDVFNLSGPLLDRQSGVDCQWFSGEYINYAGREIAIYIGPRIQVRAIHILAGTKIRGDIISRWDPLILHLSPDLTASLTFGLKKNLMGRPLEVFQMSIFP